MKIEIPIAAGEATHVVPPENRSTRALEGWIGKKGCLSSIEKIDLEKKNRPRHALSIVAM